MGKPLLKNGTIPPNKLLNNTLASCSLRNFDFLILHTEDFNKSIILPFFVFKTSGFLLCVFFYTLNNKITLFYIKFKILIVIRILISSCIS